MGMRSILRSVLRLFRRRDLSNITCETIVFKTDLWLIRMRELGLQPSFVGKDIECPKARKQKVVALAIPADDKVLSDTQKLFFKSLHNYTYDKFTKEVTFKKHNLVLNVSALEQDEVITLKDPRLLFNDDKDIYTAMQYLGSNKIWRLDPQTISRSSGDPTRLLERIEQGFSIDFHVESGTPYRQDFQAPGPPAPYPIVFGSSRLPNLNP